MPTTKPKSKSKAGDGTNNVNRCLDAIRAMVLSGELLPGQKLTQAGLAGELKVSRIPIREALATLHAEGLLDHKPHTGYTVARFSSEDLKEIYLMRRLLETELLRTIDYSHLDLDALAATHEELQGTSPDEAPDRFQELNMRFHFILFEASPLDLVRDELARLWHMSAFYRSLYLFEEDTQTQLGRDHKKILSAAKGRKTDRLIEVSDEHRTRTERMVVQRLRRRARS
jgi:DNA-binding GntR family transcriptional regulator